MKKYFVELDNQRGTTYVVKVSKDDVVDTVWQDCIYSIPFEIVNKYNLKSGDNKQKIKDKYEDDEDILDEIFDHSNGVSPLVKGEDTDYLDLNSLNENKGNGSLYYDNYSDELYDAETILGWETVRVYCYHDGSNCQVKEVKDELDLEVEENGSERYNTGTYIRYALENGKEIQVDDSMYQGSLTEVNDISTIQELKELAGIED
ncbi:MAG: hypothetical protein LBG21_06240 [Campylobacteraceae bacterium]|jgi:hypothetical protein|nr:hypothetical protein [Campylobacteraceae bacterium]